MHAHRKVSGNSKMVNGICGKGRRITDHPCLPENNRIGFKCDKKKKELCFVTLTTNAFIALYIVNASYELLYKSRGAAVVFSSQENKASRGRV